MQIQTMIWGAGQCELVLCGARQEWRGLSVAEGGLAWESAGKVRSGQGRWEKTVVSPGACGTRAGPCPRRSTIIRGLLTHPSSTESGPLTCQLNGPLLTSDQTVPRPASANRAYGGPHGEPGASQPAKGRKSGSLSNVFLQGSGSSLRDSE